MADRGAVPIIGDRTRACGGIGRRARLRALWGVSPVGVRVSLGALSKPARRAGFDVLEAPCPAVPSEPAGNILATVDREPGQEAGQSWRVIEQVSTPTNAKARPSTCGSFATVPCANARSAVSRARRRPRSTALR